MLKKIIYGSLLSLAIIGITFLVKAAPNDNNIVGWFWAGSNTNFGWISATNANQNGSISYNLKIPSGDGNITGYAWSSNLGWVDFSPQEHCGSAYQANCNAPSGDKGGVKKEGNNLTGWARIVGIAQEEKINNSGGWRGWIKMRGKVTNGQNYGVHLDSHGKLSGYAWSNELGWVSFGQAKACGIDSFGKNLVICENTCGNNNPLTSLTMSEGDNKNLKACLSASRNSCSGLDVTGLATWTENSSAFDLTGGVDKIIQAKNKGNGNIQIKYNYRNLETNLPVKVN